MGKEQTLLTAPSMAGTILRTAVEKSLSITYTASENVRNLKDGVYYTDGKTVLGIKVISSSKQGNLVSHYNHVKKNLNKQKSCLERRVLHCWARPENVNSLINFLDTVYFPGQHMDEIVVLSTDGDVIKVYR
jgi:hypothetical protein